MSRKAKEEGGFLLGLIVWERACKGTLLILLGIGLLSFGRRGPGEVIKEVVRALNLDVDRRSVQAVVGRLELLTGKAVIQISLAALILGVLDWIQAIGLYYKKRWAEFFTLVSVSLLIPFEVVHFWERWNALRALGVGLNALVVIYLYRRLQHGK